MRPSTSALQVHPFSQLFINQSIHPAAAVTISQVSCISSEMRHPLFSPLPIVPLSPLSTSHLAPPTRCYLLSAHFGTFVLALNLTTTLPASGSRARGYQRKLRHRYSGQTSCLFPLLLSTVRVETRPLQDCTSIRNSGSIES